MRLGEANHSSRLEIWRQWVGARGVGFAVALIVASVLATYFVTTQIFRSGVRNRIHHSAHELGHEAFGEQVSLVGDLIGAPGRLQGAEESPELVLDIKFKHMRKIYAKREEALSRGLLVQGPDDMVPASIRQAGRSTRVSLRLKGDLADHFEGDKWSFRIHVKDGDHVFGMRRFSLQHPAARGYQAELLFLETMRHLDVLAPRYRFVELTVNGNDVGLMALEEHFSKELLESNGRKDSVILKFDENLVWSAGDGFSFRGFGGGAFDSYRNARVDVFAQGRVDRDALLSTHYSAAAGMLRGFIEGELTPSEVFDVERTGRFLAASQVWGAWHAVRWHNLRFSYDPYAAQLEPVAFDASLAERPRTDLRVVDAEPIAAALLADPAIFRAYHRALQEIAAGFESGALTEKLEATEDDALRALHAEFLLLPRYPIARIQERAAKLATLTADELRVPLVEESRYPALVHARIVSDGETTRLELDNAVPHEVEVRGLRWVPAVSDPPQDKPEFDPRSWVLPATPAGGLAQTMALPLSPALDVEATLELKVGFRGRPESRILTVSTAPGTLAAHPLPAGDAFAAARDHTFLTHQPVERKLVVAAGTHLVTSPIDVPAGYRLEAGPGTTLRFGPDAMLFARGPLSFSGTAADPIVLEAESEAGWLGIAVLDAAGSSTLEHVTIRNTGEVKRPGWHLTGGTNFIRSDIVANEVRFEGSRGEDALNVVSARLTLNNVWFDTTRSDALDADFSTGTVVGGGYRDIGLAGGGDAIDLSGSEIEVRDVRLERIGDKGLSVGEASRLLATDVMMRDVGAGAVSKDGSSLELRGGEIRDARVAALMAYVKKPEYGPGQLQADGVELTGSGNQPRAQDGSTLLVDGQPIETEPLDVDALYETAMKKAAAQ
jgi:hypothetical protein